MLQRRQRRDHREQPARFVGDDRGKRPELLVVAGQRQQIARPRRRLDQIVERLPSVIGAARSVTDGLYVDDIGLQRRDFGVTEAQPLHRFGPHIVNEHIASAHQFAQRLFAVAALQIERH